MSQRASRTTADPRRHPGGRRRGVRTALAAALALLAALLLAACGGSSEEQPEATGGATAEPGALPTRITHAYGTTEVPREPRRVVTLGWSDADVTIALGTTPVGTFDNGPDFPSGVGPWAAERIRGAKPKTLSLTDGVPLEEIAALRPDLILSVQSGLEEADYDKLARIAPTVAFKAGRAPFLTPWQEQAATIGAALGRPREAARLVERTNAAVARAKRENPGLDGRTFTYASSIQPGQVAVYSPEDLRVRVLAALGLRTPRPVAALAEPGVFFTNVSTEEVDRLDADLLVAWFSTPELRRGFESSPAVRRLPAVREGRYVTLDAVEAQAQGAPTVLSIPWALDRVVPRLAEAAGRGAR